MDCTYLGKMPWDAFVLLLCLFDPTFKPTVGEGVALVELKVAFVVEKAPSSFWQDVLDSVRGNDCCRKVNEVFSSWL